jgi:hypothetical protein
MQRYIFISFFLFSSLWGSFSEPTRWEFSTGYRNDRLHWHLQNPGDGGALNYSEVYRDLQFWENALSLIVYHRDIYFFLNGGYGAFGKGGSMTQRYANLSYTSDQPHFTFTPNGWAAEGTGRFGYCVNLTDGRTYKTVLIPFIGFSVFYEQLQAQDPQPDSRFSTHAIGADSYTMSSSLPGHQSLAWYGFLLGGAFHIDPGGRLLFDVGYNYNWLHVRFHTHYANEVFFGAPLLSNQSSYSSIKAKTSGNVGQTGWAKVSYKLYRGWQIGLGGQLNYFVSRDFDAKNHQTTNQAVEKISEKIKIRWTSVSGLVNISNSF